MYRCLFCHFGVFQTRKFKSLLKGWPLRFCSLGSIQSVIDRACCSVIATLVELNNFHLIFPSFVSTDSQRMLCCQSEFRIGICESMLSLMVPIDIEND
mmetsp:Transcript_4126/g.9143  ORF Transcript_4126/g.9143 Transcript_4126/m.9143 type:complete len:98 (-) Transcript_4126:1206-1499(-)